MHSFRKKFRAKSQGRYGKRHKPGEMNKTEETYAETLEAKRLAGEISAWWFEPITFKLADDTRYTPDFGILHIDGAMEFVDTKVLLHQHSLVKVKCAAEKFFPFLFAFEQKLPAKKGGGWKRTEF